MKPLRGRISCGYPVAWRAGEEALLFTPKVSMQGQPKLVKKTITFDYVFG